MGSKCVDLVGRYSCQCAPGFVWVGDNTACVDVSATCAEEGQRAGPGSCVCTTGYAGVPKWDLKAGAWTNPCRGESR